MIAEEKAALRRIADAPIDRCAAGWRQGSIANEVVRRLERDELVQIDGARATITEIGRGVLQRELDPDAPNRWLVRRGSVGRQPLMANLGESPLAWLMRRRMISPRQFEAGERLRADHSRAHAPPSVTMRWDPAPTAKTRSVPGGPLDPTGSQIEARRRFEAATSAVGPGLADVLARVVCEGQGLEAAERAIGWPARAGKVVLGLALDRLAEHYRPGSGNHR